MSNFPTALDDDSTLPAVNNNITQLGGASIDAARDAIFAIENNIGLNAQGTTASISQRLLVSINPDGTIIPSALTSLGLVTLPITNNQIANFAAIPESKLQLDYKTVDLFNYILSLTNDINIALGWVSATGVKLDPHLIGALYRHTLDQIDVSGSSSNYLFNNLGQLRNNTQAYTLINDINNELLNHQWSDGYAIGTINNITTHNGQTFPNNYGHTASGIFLNTSRFVTVPQNNNDVQLFADYIDSANILLLGTRIQNLYSNGISVNSRSSSLINDGYGQSIVPPTLATAFLLGNGINSIPVDDINNGDDIIQFTPAASVLTNNSFDEQFSLVQPGDIIRINYNNGIELQFVISERKYQQDFLGNKLFIVRILGKNLIYTTGASARIDRPLFNNDKYGVLAIAGANNQFNQVPSLIVGSPRGAQALGLNFNPDQFDSTHYLLYLVLYHTGNPLDGQLALPAIDVTGNLGVTAGTYTLDSIVESTNNAFRANGYNYRFIAFSYNGNFGIMLADSYNNAGFSIINADVDSSGVFLNDGSYPNNVVGIFSTGSLNPPDPLGFGPFNANIASPVFSGSYSTPQQAINSTLVFTPLKRNNYYVNGVELERLNIQTGQLLDKYGDGYWAATISSQAVVPPFPTGRVQTTYSIPLNLSSTDLKVGKTLVVQSIGTDNQVDEGRFIIQSITFVTTPTPATLITVYDSVHGQGGSPAATSPVGTSVAIYFNSDSVGFNAETATDFATPNVGFRRYFEVLADGSTNTFTHERARFVEGGVFGFTTTVNDSLLHQAGDVGKLNIIEVSPKLRGYAHGTINKITINIINLSVTTGFFDGYLCNLSDNGLVTTNMGPIITGKMGEVVRFYDESNIDYIDILYDFTNVISDISNQISNQYMDIQLFPTLSLDDELMLLASCQVSDTSTVNYITDRRQFGNISEEELSTSALNYIAAPERLLHFNGIVRGCDLANNGVNPNPNGSQIYVTGGVVLVNGAITLVNSQTFTVPIVYESISATQYPINWAMCVNSAGELICVVLTDYDAALGTPNVGDRVVTVVNAITSSTYSVDSVNFSYLLNSRKDLTVLYIISSTVSGVDETLTVRDVRRFVNNSDSSYPATLTNTTSQGNFKSLLSAYNWLKFNNTYQDTLFVKSAYTFTSDPGLNSHININGISSASLTFSSAVTMSNVNFKNLDLTFSSTLAATNVTFDNCNIIFGGICALTDGYIESSIVTNNNNISLSQSEIRRSDITCFGDGYGISCLADAKITGNTIVNGDAPISLIYISGTGSVTVKDNSFNRNGVTIQSYVLGTIGATNTVIITDNIFDSQFVDIGNSIETVGLNIPNTWVFYRNINQTYCVPIPIAELNDTSYNVDGYPVHSQSVDAISEFTFNLASSPFTVNVTGNIAKYLPVGTTLLYSVIGLSLIQAGSVIDSSSTNTSSYTLSLQKSAAFTSGSFVGSLADNVGLGYTTSSATTTSNMLNINSPTIATLFNTTTQYMFIDLSSLNWTMQQSMSLDITVNGTFTAANSSSATMAYSPLLVKFRW